MNARPGAPWAPVDGPARARYPAAVLLAPRAAARLAAALALGAAASCFEEDFLLGAWCVRDGDCATDQCCAGSRCRPRPDHCDRGVGFQTPYEYAYMPCDRDADCLAHGMPQCVVWMGAARGFCTDLCHNDDPLDCERHTASNDRACVDADGQRVCALDCSRLGFCPAGTVCLADVCIPEVGP